MSCTTISNRKNVRIRTNEVTYPEPYQPRLVEEDQDERSPETTKHRHKPKNEAQDQRWGDQVTKRLHPQKPRERIALHRLEDIIFRNIKNLWVIAAELLDCCRHILGD